MTDKLAVEKELLGKITKKWRMTEDMSYGVFIMRAKIRTQEENSANCQLINSAPDLLRDNIALREALRELIKHSRQIVRVAGFEKGWSHAGIDQAEADLSSSEVREGK